MADIPERLGQAFTDRYVIERVLGRGGMATVYLARDRKHHRNVAIKVLHAELAAVLGSERFLREIETAANLQHPHILPLHDSGEAGGFFYYVMPFVAGASLRDKLGTGRPLPTDEAIRVIAEVVDALAYAHQQGIVHRDIKPDNILFSGRHALVTDFGIAKAVHHATGPQQLTATGMSIGTPDYMAPEQITAEPNIDHRADIYAVGVVGYELLTGRRPFRGNTSQAVLAAHVTQQPDPPSEHDPNIPPELDHIILRCLAKDPIDRWTTAEELHSSLDNFRSSMTTIPYRSPRKAFTNRWAPLAGGLGAVVLAVLGMTFLRGDGSAGPSASVDRVAVFPFAVRSASPELEYLGEGIADLMATALDGTAGIRSVDLNALVRAVADENEPPDFNRAELIARELAANQLILGSVTDAGAGRIQLRASLYPPGKADPIQVESIGTQDRVLELVRDATGQLLAAVLGRSIGDSLGMMTTDSVEALKAYVAGAQAYRQRDFRAAVDELRRATLIDPGFALAYHKLAMAAGWAGQRQIVEPASAEALRLADRLSERHRLLLTAGAAYNQQDPETAETAALELVAKYPNDAEGWYILGETRFHYNHTFGRPPSQGVTALERAVSIDPGRADAWMHLYDEAFANRDPVKMEDLDRVRGADSSAAPVARALEAGDLASLDSLRPQYSGSYYWLYRIGLAWQDIPEALRTIDPWSESENPNTVAIHGIYAGSFHASAGRPADAIENLNVAVRNRTGEGLVWSGLVVLGTWPSFPDSVVARVRGQLQRWQATAEPTCDELRTSWCVHNDVYPILRYFLIGALGIRLNGRASVDQYVDSLLSHRGTEETERFARDKAATLRALWAAAEGNHDDALDELRVFESRFSVAEVRDSPFKGRWLENRIAARALYRLGRDDEAIDRLNASKWTPWGMAERRMIRGEIFERVGDYAQALREYDLFLELWRNADQAYQPIIDDVRSRIVVLLEARQ